MSSRLSLLIFALLPLLQACAPAVITGGAAAVAVVHDRRSTGTVIEDKEISLRVFNHIQKNPELKKYSDVSTTSFNRRVLLTGAAASPAVSRQIVDYVKGLRNVREVINEIEVHPEYNGGIQGTLNDGFITSQAKLRLFNVKLPTFDPTRVDVTTYNGTIHLMGMVSQTEGSAAAEEVRYVKGAKRVVKHFEYISLPPASQTQAKAPGSANLERIH